MFISKDSLSLYLQSHFLHKFQCSNNSITNYGDTERHLKVRAGEHIDVSTLTEKRINNNKKSAVKNPCLLPGHVFNNFTLLNYEQLKFKRLIKKSLLVTTGKP